MNHPPAPKSGAPFNRWSAVVIGAMNPAIHHPLWYQSVALLTPAEVERALSSGATFVVPQMARFQFDSFEIQCLADRWQVATADQSQLERVLTLAGATFRRLNDTPVERYGLNCLFDVDVDARHSQDVLNEQVSGPLGSIPIAGQEQPEVESIRFSYDLDELRVKGQPLVQRVVKLTLQPSPAAEGLLRIDLNIDHKVQTAPQMSHFDLDVLIQASRSALNARETIVERVRTKLGTEGK